MSLIPQRTSVAPAVFLGWLKRRYDLLLLGLDAPLP
jgi:hypothetical protein